MQCPGCGYWVADPAPANCERCGVSFHGDARSGPAWERRDSALDLTALVETVKSVLSQPVATFKGMKRSGGIGGPLWYTVLLGTVSGWVSILWQAFFQSLGFFADGIGDEEIFGLVGLVLFGALMPLFVVIGAFVSTLITHVCLFLIGGARKDLETTLRVTCYAGGSTSLFNLFPLCGGLIAFVWNIVVMIIGVRETHEISTTKAVIAILLPVILCCACAIWIVTFFFGAALSQGWGGI